MTGPYSASSSRFSTLPLGLVGRLSRNTILRGRLYDARSGLARQNASIASPRKPGRVRNDERRDDAAPFRIGQSHDRRFLHARTPVEHLLDFARIDVLAAGDDHVVDAAAKIEEAFAVPADEIAGIEPAVAKLRRPSRPDCSSSPTSPAARERSAGRSRRCPRSSSGLRRPPARCLMTRQVVISVGLPHEPRCDSACSGCSSSARLASVIP